MNMRMIGCVTVLTLLLTACSAPAPTSQPLTPTPIPSGMVDVGGYELFYQCSGQGSPTVILEAGGGGDSSSWTMVQSGGDRSYRVCSYDRANLGQSDKAPKPRTFQDIARDLHTLLVNAQIAGPYILVGHSMGGMLVRVYRDQYPDEVAGLVLVESAHPDMGPRLLAALPPESLLESRAIGTWRKFLDFQWKGAGRESYNQEGVDIQGGNALVKTTNPLGDLPLVVISRSPGSAGFPNMPPLPAETNTSLSRIWQDMQSELAELSTHSTRVIAAHAGHMIPTEEPEPVIEAIRTLVNDVRSRGVGETPAPAQRAGQAGASNHTPVILRVVERTENEQEGVALYKDLYFTDAAGDATIAANKLISSTVLLHISDDVILASAAEQQGEALVTSEVHCGKIRLRLAIEYRILDRAGNLSAPTTLAFVCPGAPGSISPWLIIGPVAGFALVATAAWLLVRRRRARRTASSPA